MSDLKWLFSNWNQYLVLPYLPAAPFVIPRMPDIQILKCTIKFERTFFILFYWLKGDYLLVVDISQDASQDLQQEDTQEQDKILEEEEKKIQLVDGNVEERQVAKESDEGAFKVTHAAWLARQFTTK